MNVDHSEAGDWLTHGLESGEFGVVDLNGAPPRDHRAECMQWKSTSKKGKRVTQGTFNSIPIPAGPVLVRVSCEPTYATSHRWNWPDETGSTRCACGATSETSWTRCGVHARAFGPPDPTNALAACGEAMGEESVRVFDPVVAERERFARLRARPMHDDGTPDATVQALGEWVGPDVQAYEAPLGEGGRIGGHVWALRIQVSSEHRDAVEEAIMCGQGRVVTHSAHKAHGGIVRLGCPEREADGVTAR